MTRLADVLIPVKAPAQAKSRLSAVLDPAARLQLQRAMLCDMLDELRAAATLRNIVLLGQDEGTAAFAAANGLGFLWQDRRAEGLNAALQAGAAQLIQRDAPAILAVLPGDLPLLRAQDLDFAVRRAHDLRECMVAPDRRRQGTNGIVTPAHSLPRFRFGENSYRNHLERGDSPLALHAQSLLLPSFASDIDTPDDLRLLRSMPRSMRGLRTRALAESCPPLVNRSPSGLEIRP